MKSRIVSMLAIVAVFCCGIADAQIPQKLNYQGFITSPSGAPVNASVQMVFTIYPAATGPASVHTEMQTVTVSNGIFNVILGTNATLSATFDTSYWLGVAVGADPEMSPRQPLAASPYALRAVTAESLAPGGNIVLTDPSTASVGNIMKGTSRFIHNPGFANTFVGVDSGNFTVTGSSNTITGANALGNVTSGSSNTASGYFALIGNTSGSYNIALGTGAGGALTTGDFNIAIGNAGVAGEAATTRIGSSQTRAFMAGVRGVTPAVNDALPVVIDSNGQLGTGVSVSNTLAGDVTGPQSATVVALVGGVTAANVAAGANLANAATNANTASTVVKRDASGNFSAGTITGTFSGPLTGNVTGNVSGSASGFTGALGGDVGGLQAAITVFQVGGATAANVAAAASLVNAASPANTAGAIVRRDASGNFNAGTISGNVTGNVSGNVTGSASSFTGALAGDVTGPQSATVVALVGGVTAANVAAGANLANAATTANTAGTIVKRDASGNFSAGTISTTGGVKFSDGTTQTTAAPTVTGLSNSAGNTLSTVDSAGTVGWYTSITLGADGLPVISYYDVNIGDLKVAKCSNPACTGASTLTTVDSVGDVGRFTSITLGADGLPVISYHDFTNGDLKVAKCSNPACTGASTLTTVDSGGNVGGYSSITLGADGLPVISYLDQTNGDLKVAKCSNPACTGASTSTTVDSVGTVGFYTSITLGADGLPLISYYDNTNGYLKVAKCSNPACTGASTLTTVDSGGDVGRYTSITLGADGLPLISYYDNTNGYLKVAKCSNPACTGASTLTTVDSGGDVGRYTSITLGADGLPVISYFDNTNSDLKVAKCSSAACVPFVRRR